MTTDLAWSKYIVKSHHNPRLNDQEKNLTKVGNDLRSDSTAGLPLSTTTTSASAAFARSLFLFLGGSAAQRSPCQDVEKEIEPRFFRFHVPPSLQAFPAKSRCEVDALVKHRYIDSSLGLQWIHGPVFDTWRYRLTKTSRHHSSEPCQEARAG